MAKMIRLPAPFGPHFPLVGAAVVAGAIFQTEVVFALPPDSAASGDTSAAASAEAAKANSATSASADAGATGAAAKQSEEVTANGKDAGSAKPAAALAPAAEGPAWETAPSLRRAGFSMGVLLGGSLGNVSGYPNDVAKRGKPEFLTDTGFAYGGNATLWLGGALADWLVFGAGLSASYAQGNGTVVQGFTFLFRTEIFPLFSLGGAFHDLGLSVDTGAGSYTGEVENKPSGDAGKLIAPVIESGAASRVGIGAFYDGLRVSKLSGGPFVSFDYTWSSNMAQPLLMIGFRGALYVKAPKKQ